MNRQFTFLSGLLALWLGSVSLAAEWQWSVPMGAGRAFLWVPPRCKQVRAVVVGPNNMIESGILEHANFRKTLAAENMAAVLIAPPFDFIFRFDRDAGERFNDLMQRLAEASGYSELNHAPIAPMGHSACASFPWNFAAWNPGRTLAVLSVHGDGPLTKFTGCGQPNPDWGDRNLDGVPGLMVMAEYEWGDAEHGVDRLGAALEYRRQHPQTPIAMLAEPGEGHFNYSDDLVAYLAMFLRKAARERLPRQWELSDAPVLTPVNPAKGWLVERWHLNQSRKFSPAPVGKFKGDTNQAFWCFDKEMAWATHNYKADQPGKRPQLLSISDGVMPSVETCGEPVRPKFLPEADGVTFRLYPAFMDFVPGDANHNQNAARWAYATPGTRLGHAKGGGPIRLHKLAGPVEQIGSNVFRLSLNRLNSADPGCSTDIWIWASHPGDAEYKSMVQQAQIRVHALGEGREQTINFPEISAVNAGVKMLTLHATSDAG